MSPPIHITETGSGPRVVLVHRAMTTGARAWTRQAPLAERWRLVVPDRRGFGASPAAEICDFEVDVVDVEPLLGDGAHLVGHSFGGLVALLLAARSPERVRSLTLIEPAGHALAPDAPDVLETVARYEHLRGVTDPEEFLDAFLAFLGLPADGQPRPMGTRTAQHVGMAMRERRPWSATIRRATLAGHPYPVQVVSGGRGDVFDTVSDAVACAYGPGTRRELVAGAPHDVQSVGGAVNPMLEAFWLSVPPNAVPEVGARPDS